MTLLEPLEIFVDGPFGSPSSNIYRAEHAVLIGTGIGITPFASILQSIMHRYLIILHTKIITSIIYISRYLFIYVHIYKSAGTGVAR